MLKNTHADEKIGPNAGKQVPPVKNQRMNGNGNSLERMPQMPRVCSETLPTAVLPLLPNTLQAVY